MKKKVRNPLAQPTQGEVQLAIQALNDGYPEQAEVAARQLAKKYPAALMPQNLLGVALERQQRFAEAAKSYRRVLEIDPSIAEIHFNLGVVIDQQGKPDEAIRHYRKAVRLKPGLAVAHVNLGLALQNTGKQTEAVDSFRQALAREPRFAEAHAGIGTVLQQQGAYDDAIGHYRQALELSPDAKIWFSLGTAQRNHGLLDDAAESFRQALDLDPRHAEALSNLGDVLWHQGKVDEAATHFRQALQIAPDNRLANYNLGVFLYDNERLEEAIPHFQASRMNDWRERALYCLYKSERFDEFRAGLGEALQHNSRSPLLATLSSHHALNFGVEDPCRFCPAPLDFVYHGAIPELADPDNPLLQELLQDIRHREIAERGQSRLHHGTQSAGNLLRRPEASFQQLATLLERTIREYYAKHADADCEFIRQFPEQIEFGSSWYVKMRQGGYLDSHIHEDGWISGSVYLAIPERSASPEEGCIELSMHGDRYPQKHDDFPTKLIPLQVGDVCFFPSSVFHRTIPFEADQERICIAFDVKPAPLS
ncbi:tetratricopeptide repeat protein [Methylonatrum kenyense]|uniref:tetratricopeptide repeat protein n=1 Tax=Methylonatrum kenyense TaxID=455253 RepID=UPI0020C0DEB8|nr:tetratricopeptide repeat protein [Methylonatrum kenyense]MCK8515526.1 tetratricopeptide repeat protein [Methylonatrum kenyense]